ncbi:LytTR family DNA-binding domain-containing protein [Aquimarina sp. MMG016]|uniref:LytR/AlgR family response regulator transcription factor n=1 Tax=Aquimarina sp. MMG016 TaxID=2822690 RepID=UPI001B3A5939|nr:LytTR family DNA-binding domain-containing protein [Aquimarina sp. MMG016]MBQ4822011.1 response regulator transcription factor [Aquimarina sp. MMG016]
MNLKCLIVDDEPIAQNIVKGFITDIPNLEVLGVCDNAMEALKILQEQSVDILFLDIEMPKITGLSFLKTLSKPPATIITTAYREFALEGFELDVVDYLLKPFSFERFLKAVNKVCDHKAGEHNETKVSSKTYEYFKVDRKNIRVDYDNIIYIEGLSNYVKIHLQDKHLVVYHKLIDLEKLLPDNQFIRIHKSYIIAVDKIKAYGNDYVEILDKQLSIGNTYKDHFFSKLSEKNKNG